MKEPIIELAELTKRYGEQTAVDRLTLTVYRGEIFGLLGPNGAGKSTTILMMLGLAEPTSGTVTVCGVNSTRQPILVKRKVGYLPDDVGFYEDMSGLENLLFTARLNGLSRKEGLARAESLLERVGLGEAGKKKAGKYSRGMRQRLGLADVLIKKPEVIILDEPTLGIDPEGVREFLQLIRQLSRDEGITVLLSSHHLHQVQQICDRVGLFVAGRMLAEGDIHSLSRQLFQEESMAIEVQIKGGSARLLDNLRQIDGVGRVEAADDERLVIHCSKEVTAEISRTIVESGAALLQLTQKEYGLDEIYHRYFEGGEAS
ncbi:ABC transporter ATP-binding protein [Brevibacillus marinus]|uniref:ABC transporter ATP-binding protein n=1 Tax=Brevibacillus marinus TaxID=2496837 RepID=UPI000F824457|nr:ABC transporter ATP-binding protein [Brevibacillus marinus]